MANGGTSSVSYGYDVVNRLSSLGHDLAGAASDQSFGFGYNPASQIVSRSSGNDAYAYTGATNVSRGYRVNGLNQYTAVAGNTYTYDANGNLTFDGTSSYTYDAENRLVGAGAGVGLTYDPNGRLWQVSSGSGTTEFLYDGDQLSAEYDGSGNRLRRYVHGTSDHDPMVWYEGSGLTARLSLQVNWQGSIVSSPRPTTALLLRMIIKNDREGSSPASRPAWKIHVRLAARGRCFDNGAGTGGRCG